MCWTFCYLGAVDVFRLWVTLESKVSSALGAAEGGSFSLANQSTRVTHAQLKSRWFMVAGLCLGAVSSSQAQITQDVYVGNSGDNTASVIDAATNTVRSTVNVGSIPFGGAVTPDGKIAYVVNNNANTVSAIDTTTNAVISTIIVGTMPAGVAVTPDGSRAYVTNQQDNTVSVINTATNTVVDILNVGNNPALVAVTPDGLHAYVTNNSSGTVSVIDTTTNTVTSTTTVQALPVGVAVTPDGSRVYIANSGSNTVSVINTATNAVVDTLPVGGPSLGDPEGIAITPDGQHVYVTNGPDDTVSVINTVTNVVTSIAVPGEPEGVALTPDGLHAYVTNFLNNTVSEIDTITNAVVSFSVGSGPLSYGNFVGPNLITGTLSVGSESALTSLGFGQFVDFRGGTLRTTAALDDSHNLSLLSPGGTVDTNGFNSAFSGPIIGIGALTKTGAGTLQLTGTNTYTGGTTISGGTLQVGNGGTTGSIVGNVLDNAHLVFDRSDAVTFTGNVSGTGMLEQAGPGTLKLSGTNTYSGATTISAGTLQAGSGTAFSPNSAFTVNGVLDLNGFVSTVGSLAGTGTVTTTVGGFPELTVGGDNSSTTFGGTIMGAGSFALTKIGTGTMTLSGTNTYSGGTTVAGGVISVAADANLGNTAGGITLAGGTLMTTANFVTSRLITLNSPGPPNILLAANGTTATYNGIISGPGSLQLGGSAVPTPATIILNGNNQFVGGTRILGITVVAGGNNALGTGPVQIFGGVLDILAGFTLGNPISLVLAGTVNNAGTLNNNISDGVDGPKVVINSGTIIGNIQLAGGQTNLVENLTGGAITGQVTLAGAIDTVQLFNGSKITGDVSLSGTGGSNLILDGTGQQSLSAAVTGTVTNNGSLVKQGSGTWTIDKDLSAPIETDVLAGTLVLSATLTTAQINVSSVGTLQLGNGGTTGSYVGPIVDNGSLIFDRTDTVTFAGPITGSGNVIQAGTGTTVLSGANTYSGGTIIDLGNLVINNAEALGTGNVVVNGGVLSADPQPINVGGNYTQNAGGTLQLSIAGRAAGQFDTLNIGGNAALNGTLRLLNLGYQPQNGDKLRLITTGGTVSGRFSLFQNPFVLAAGFNTIDLVYARQAVVLEFLNTASPIPVVATTDFSSFAFTPNQLAAANLLDAVQLDPRAANLISFLDTEPFSNFEKDFQKISPDGLTAFYEISFSNANIQKLNLESRLDDIHNGSNGFSSNMKINGATVNPQDRASADGKSSKAVVEPILQHAPENRWGVWVTGFGDFVDVNGDGNASDYNFTTGGVSLGLDYRITDQLAIGVMGEYSHTWTSLNPGGHIDVDSGRGGVYATWFSHGFYLNGAIYGGHNTYDSGRAGLAGLANGSTEGSEWSTFIGGGYDFHLGPLTIGPVASLQYTDVGIDSFSEHGSLAPLAIHSGSAESLRSDVGFRLFYQWQIGKILLEPSLKAAWEHEYKYSALPITAGFTSVPGPSATFFGPAEGHDSAVISAGLSAQVTSTITVYVNYDGQLGRDNYDSNAVTGGVRISF